MSVPENQISEGNNQPVTPPVAPQAAPQVASITVLNNVTGEPIMPKSDVVPPMRPPSFTEPIPVVPNPTPTTLEPVTPVQTEASKIASAPVTPKASPLSGNASMVSEISKISGINRALGTEEAESVAAQPHRDPVEEAKFGIKSLRTYEEDVASLIRNPETTVAKVVIAEKARQEKVEKKQEIIVQANKKIAWKNIVYGLMSVLLLTIAGGLGFGIWQTITRQAPATEGIVIGIIETNAVTPITYTGRADFRTNLAGVVSETTPAGSIREFKFKTATTNTDGVVTAGDARIGDVLDFLGLSLPEGFIRSLDPEYMIGEYGTDAGDRPFMMLFTRYYQSTYAGMLRYEDQIVDELGILGWPFKPVAESIATTTSAVGRAPVVFVDEIIENRDVRRGIDRSNNTMLIWSFINKDTLIIAPDTATFTEILDRLNKRSYIR